MIRVELISVHSTPPHGMLILHLTWVILYIPRVDNQESSIGVYSLPFHGHGIILYFHANSGSGEFVLALVILDYSG